MENNLFVQKRVPINGIEMNYYEQGKGEPILYLHGIPVNSFLWRNIVPATSTTGRSVAVDLAGYGLSDVPPGGDYSIQKQYDYLKGFIDHLGLKNITLVVNDLGSLLGLKFAVENRDRIKRIVFIEAVFMPTQQWYRQLSFQQKMMFLLFRNKKIAYHWIVKKNKIPEMMIGQMVVRKLSDEEKDYYLNPYKTDMEKRKVILEGPGPATFPPGGKKRSKGDFADEVDKVAKGLIELNRKVPFLILYARPGIITRRKALKYARKNFEKLTMINLGHGKHFLQEDHPGAIARHIKNWIEEN
ncbi:MAG TPA: haloalkane dehalogenase [Caldithrix abyssi]|uniref:Haloalkane dehalogenase n=1 Tax=Caldithrix abyssi TaxID=187145 RepID=A0A7V1PVB4_CALAY|nr:haloalkane dehalogenase [Caldithrix abyssi]